MDSREGGGGGEREQINLPGTPLQTVSLGRFLSMVGSALGPFYAQVIQIVLSQIVNACLDFYR